MNTLLEHLNESLLDNEEELVADDKYVMDQTLKDFQDFFTNTKRNKNIEVSKIFVLDNQVKKGGACKIIPISGPTQQLDILNSIQDKRKIKYADKKYQIYSGDYEIHGPIQDWPIQLKIGNPRNLTIYSKEQITQNMIPDMCLSLDISHMNAVAGLKFTCRYANIMEFKKLNNPVIINTYSDSKLRSEVIDIYNKDNAISNWKDLSNIVSNCKYLTIMGGDIVNDTIKKYDDPENKTHYYTKINEPDLSKIQQTNLKNIETIYLYDKSDNFYYLTFYKGKWEFHSNKQK